MKDNQKIMQGIIERNPEIGQLNLILLFDIISKTELKNLPEVVNEKFEILRKNNNQNFITQHQIIVEHMDEIIQYKIENSIRFENLYRIFNLLTEEQQMKIIWHLNVLR